MVKSKDSIFKDYQNNVEIQETLIHSLKKTLNNISLQRLGLFLVEIAFVALIISSGYDWPIGILMCIPVLAFMYLVKRQTAVQQELDYAKKLLFVFKNELNIYHGGKNGYADGTVFACEEHPYSADLDIYGSSSLYAFINRSNTVTGMKLLADSLGKHTEPNLINERQSAIAELISHIHQTFHFRAGLQSHKPEQLDIIVDKLNHDMPEQLKFTRNKLLQYYVSFTPFLSLSLIIAGTFYGGVNYSFLGLYVLFNAALSFFHLKHINQVYYGFSGSSGLLNDISGTIRWTEEVKWESSYISRFFHSGIAVSGNSNVPLSKRIKALSAIIQSFDIRLNILVGSFFNLFMLWDFRCAIRLGKWYDQSSEELVHGIHRISQFEELISFATLQYNEPEWSVPVVMEDFHFSTRALGHPLIKENKRIRNDYGFEATSTVDIVTGSNMAGKSTFLRSCGINMVLAFAGGPVCAAEMKVSIFELLTYMRIKDSLNDQTSTFKAELNRLKMILEGVRTLSQPLVLIDEMLRGTNSKDKYLGSKVFIQKMITEKTPALFATHDLLLSEMVDEYPLEVRNYHFDIQLAGTEMKFDYKLKHGACKTFNAAILLKEIGLSFNPEEHI
ncbi:MutS-related protein [Pedobacter sp. AW31-3R]|uniref:MutS-related protein n=1 Tax=Pedobacter sp. AW31-3R TaxID=3445781 RepID=UPI003FA1349D